MKRKIRVGAVNYLNTKPLIYGFEKGAMKDEIYLLLDHPANIGRMLLEDKIDIGLVPVAVLPAMKEYFIVSDYCIGCDGEVASVCLFSEVPLSEIERVLLDYQSQTSAALLKILIKEHWGISPALLETVEDYRQQIKGTTAGLIIGDRALEQRKISKFKYDLGFEWKQLTGLPFVFAAWISNKQMPEEFIRSFNKANETGLQHLKDVVRENHYPFFDLKEYYTAYIRYLLSTDARKGLDTFIQKMPA